jgi:hypothetical protein
MNDTLVVVLGSLTMLCVLCVFALVFRPHEFRSNVPRNATPRQPDHTRPVVPRPEMPPHDGQVANAPHWPRRGRSDFDQWRGDPA